MDVPKRGDGNFVLTSYGEIIYPMRKKILFIDPLYGKITAECENEILNFPSSIIMNKNNNVT